MGSSPSANRLKPSNIMEMPCWKPELSIILVRFTKNWLKTCALLVNTVAMWGAMLPSAIPRARTPGASSRIASSAPLKTVVIAPWKNSPCMAWFRRSTPSVKPLSVVPPAASAALVSASNTPTRFQVSRSRSFIASNERRIMPSRSALDVQVLIAIATSLNPRAMSGSTRPPAVSTLMSALARFPAPVLAMCMNRPMLCTNSISSGPRAVAAFNIAEASSPTDAAKWPTALSALFSTSRAKSRSASRYFPVIQNERPITPMSL